MDPFVYILLGAYIVTCAVALAVNPLVQAWLPASLQPGRSRAWLGSCAWLLSIVFSPVLLLGLAIYMPARWTTGLVRRYMHGHCLSCAVRNQEGVCKQEQKQKKRDKKVSVDLLEAGCNFEDSILSASDMPPMYEDCLFKATSWSPSPRSSLF